MKNSRTALSLIAVLALAGCGAVNSPGADKTPVESDDKSPLAEYLGEGFSSGGAGGMMRVTRAGGGGESSEEQLAKQRKMEDSIAACMKTAGFEYVAVPPESNEKSKFNDAFNLPPDKFAEQYGYGISTIDWATPDGEETDPNAKIRKALSPNAQKAYDKALNGELATSGGMVQAVPADGKRPAAKDMGCRGKAGEEVFGSGEDRMADFSKFDSLFKDLEALRKRVDSDQRVVDATSAWTDCMADAGHAGFQKIDDARNQVSSKLDELSGAKKNQPQKGGPSVVIGAPSLDKVDAAKLADLRKFEIELAKADQACKAKTYDAKYKEASTEHEKEFVAQHKTELEQYRDTMAER